MPIKAIVDGAEKEITRIPVLADNTYKDTWEVRDSDNQDRLLWYREDTLTGVSPISFRGYGVPLKSMCVLGNSVQNGTPAPDAPIQSQFVGERTENLFDGNLTVGYFSGANFEVSAVERFRSIRLHLKSGKYTFSFEHPVKLVRVIVDNTYFVDVATNITEYTITITDDNYDIGISFRDEREQTSWDDSPIMLNSGSTPLPYEPYGYKLPITNAGQTTPVYLGQVPTTRRIRKLVLTGDETWTLQKSGTASAYFSATDVADRVVQMQLICTHYQAGEVYTSNTGTGILVLANGGVRIREENAASSDLSAFVAFLQQQYAADTPVTIWYVLAEPETAIVNEPLCKIRSYADELTTDPNITPQTGTNTLTVDTTLSPSSVSITGHVKEVSA